MTKAD